MLEEGGWYFSMSDLMIRPPGPVPLSCFRGIPRSRAIRLAIGEARIGPPKSGVVELEVVVVVVDSSFLGGSGLDSFWGSCCCSGFVSCCFLGWESCSVGCLEDDGFEPPASSIVKSLKASTESSSTITAMGYKSVSSSFETTTQLIHIKIEEIGKTWSKSKRDAG